MDGERPGTLTDAGLDRELDAALNVEPSPEFLARIRTRIASEPAPAPWRLSWRFVTAGAGLAAAAMVVVVLAVWPRPARMEPGEAAAREATELDPSPELTAELVAPEARKGRDVSPDRGIGFDPPPNGAAAIEAVPVPQEHRLAQDSPRPRAESPLAPVFRDVLVSADQQRAIAGMLALSQQGEAVPLPVEDPAAEEVPAIQIAPIVIEAVTVVASLEGERP